MISFGRIEGDRDHLLFITIRHHLLLIIIRDHLLFVIIRDHLLYITIRDYLLFIIIRDHLSDLHWLRLAGISRYMVSNNQTGS